MGRQVTAKQEGGAPQTTGQKQECQLLYCCCRACGAAIANTITAVQNVFPLLNILSTDTNARTHTSTHDTRQTFQPTPPTFGCRLASMALLSCCLACVSAAAASILDSWPALRWRLLLSRSTYLWWACVTSSGMRGIVEQMCVCRVV